MPYINRVQRSEAWDAVFANQAVGDPGTLNFLITDLCNMYLETGKFAPRYSDYNAVIGVLECAKQEFYRRVVAPYEQKKCEDNGDVY